MMAAVYKIGDLVWAKMKGFPPWPGKVSKPPENKKVSDKKPRCYIFFFGSENYAWVPCDNVWPYLENREKYRTLSRPSNSFQEAVDAIDDYLREHGGTVPETEDVISPSPSSNKNAEENQSASASVTKRSRKRQLPSTEGQDKIKSDEDKKEGDEEVDIKPTKASKTSDGDVEVKGRKLSRRRAKADDAEEEAATGEDGQSGEGDGKAEEEVEVKDDDGKDEVKQEVEDDEKDKEEKRDDDDDGDNDSDKKKDIKESKTNKPAATKAAKKPQGATTKQTDNQKSSAGGGKKAYLPDVLPPATATTTSDVARSKVSVVATTKKIGFLGIGEIGEALVSCLLATGHHVTIWNRTFSKCKELLKKGATKGTTASDVIGKCDITFACLSDASALKDVVFGNSGVLQGISDGKGFVNLSTVDTETTMDVCEAIASRGGRFLEAPIIGSREMSKTGQLLVLTSGDQSLFEDCSSCLKSIAKNIFNLVDLGMASKMQIVLNSLYGTTLAGLAESLSLASKVGLDPSEVLEVLGHSSASSSLIREKGSDMVKNKIMDASCRLTTLQRDLRLAINMSEIVDQPLHVGSAVNELFKKAKAKGYGDADIAAIYRAADL